MNWKKALLCGGCLVLLAGCSTGQTSVSDGSQTLMTIGNKTIDKEDEYNLMKWVYGPTSAINMVNNMIYDKEIGLTDEIKKEAQKTLDQYKAMEGFEEQIIAMGYESAEDYMNQVLVRPLQKSALQEKYFSEAKQEIIDQFDPVLALIIETDSQDNANKALEALKNGEDGGKVGAQYASEDANYTGMEEIITTEDTTLPTPLLNAILDATQDGVLNEVYTNDTSTDDKIYYVAKVVSRDYDKNLPMIIKALSSNNEIATDSQVFYLKKYDFEVHDQDLFDYYKVMNPEYLVSRPDLTQTSEK